VLVLAGLCAAAIPAAYLLRLSSGPSERPGRREDEAAPQPA
jgi:hypothetical protein